MRFRLLLDVDFGTVESLMEDWIDRLKREKQEQQVHDLNHERAKQRTDDLIRSKLPEFVEQALGQIEQDVAKLQREFPNDLQYYLHFQNVGSGSVLQGSMPSSLRVQIKLDPTSTRAALLIRHPGSGSVFSKPTEQPYELRVGLDTNDILFIRFEGRQYANPQEFGSALVQFVLKSQKAD